MPLDTLANMLVECFRYSVIYSIRPRHNIMKELQFIAFLVLLVFQVESQPTTRQCSHLSAFFLPSCTNNSVLRVTKSAEMYQVSLLATEWQCYNEFCLLNYQRHRQRNISCNEICTACHQLQPQAGIGKSMSACQYYIIIIVIVLRVYTHAKLSQHS